MQAKTQGHQKIQTKHRDKNNNQKKRLKALHKISVVEVEEDCMWVDNALCNATNEGVDIESWWKHCNKQKPWLHDVATCWKHCNVQEPQNHDTTSEGITSWWKHCNE